MTSMSSESVRSPWGTLWFSPRQTIEQIVATRPRHLVLVLAILGTIASFYGQIASLGGTAYLADWRLALGFVLLSAIVGIVWLYLSALILKWIGLLLGGQAPALHLRAAIAWSTWPTILGFLLILVVGISSIGTASARQGAIALLVAIFALWSLIVFLLMLARVEHFGFWRTIATYLLNLIVALAIAVFIRTLLFHPFNVPSNAMVPTLLNGDYFFAAKFPYGYSRFSLPFSPPLFSGRIFSSEPERGDVVVFALPKDASTIYLKRVIGLPGDRIQMKDGLLYINDTPVKQERLADYPGTEPCGSQADAIVKRWRETLPNGRSYETLDCFDHGFYDNTSVYTVPAGHVFLLGDNRDNSTDSRALSQVGYVPLENLVGRADLIFFSRNPGEAGAARGVRRERIGTTVR
jgi:signal peptidase I